MEVKEIQTVLPMDKRLSSIIHRQDSLSKKVESLHHDSMEVHDAIITLNAHLKIVDEKIDKLIQSL